jgi:two-component system chemotaxis response regulator CheB
VKRKILIVEDSILMQRVIGDIIGTSKHFEVAGYARDVVEGWAKFTKLKPDVITLDYELPGENGLVLLKKVMEEGPTPVLMLSAHTKAGAELTVQALEMGAIDFFTKPSGPISIDLYNYKDELLQKLKVTASAKFPQKIKKKERRVPRVTAEMYVGVAASTGGVRALHYLIPSLPVDCGLRMVVVQHMPKYFTTSLAEHLNERSSMVVKEARDGDKVLAGEVLIAPGGCHTRVDDAGEKVCLTDEPPRHGVRPSADILFESMAQAYTDRMLGIILTGMGRDGAAGVACIKREQGRVIVQDPLDAVIGGMPQAALNTGSVDYALPLKKIPEQVIGFLTGRRI